MFAKSKIHSNVNHKKSEVKNMLRKIISLLLGLTVAWAVALTASAVTKSEVLDTIYQFDQILFGEDEVNGFTFHYYDKADSTIKDCVYLPIGESPWNAGLDMYTGPTEGEESEGYEYIIMNYTYGCPTIHPSRLGQTGCAFHIPYDGTVKITTYFRIGSAQPDSAELFIYLNEVSEGSLLLDYVATDVGVELEVENVEVKAGDVIYWFVDCMDSTANDSCDFNPRVQYTEVTDANVGEDDVQSEEPDASGEASGSETEQRPAVSETESKPADSQSENKPNATEKAGTEEKSANAGLIIGIVAAVIVAAAAVAVIIAKKKK